MNICSNLSDFTALDPISLAELRDSVSLARSPISSVVGRYGKVNVINGNINQRGQ